VPSESGGWQAFAENEWQWLNAQSVLKGFALAGMAISAHQVGEGFRDCLKAI
jgi:hypothetical protein